MDREAVPYILIWENILKVQSQKTIRLLVETENIDNFSLARTSNTELRDGAENQTKQRISNQILLALSASSGRLDLFSEGKGKEGAS